MDLTTLPSGEERAGCDQSGAPALDAEERGLFAVADPLAAGPVAGDALQPPFPARLRYCHAFRC